MQRLNITLRATGDRPRDILKAEKAIKLLRKFPGKDQFEITVIETNGKSAIIFFPDDLINADDDLLMGSLLDFIDSKDIETYNINGE